MTSVTSDLTAWSQTHIYICAQLNFIYKMTQSAAAFS